MNRRSRLGLMMIVSWQLTSVSHAGDVKLHVDITGGSFDAKSAQVKGLVRKVGDRYISDQIVVPIRSLDSGNSLRNNHMQNKYLESAKFPSAVLSNVKAEKGKFTAFLNLHGVTRPVQGEYDIKDGNVIATFKTQITGHGMSSPNYMGIGVEDEVEITAKVPYEVSAGGLPASK